jgi:hypothetical protein
MNNNVNYTYGMEWCPYTAYNPSSPDYMKGDYSTVENGSVEPAFRDNSPNKAMPPAPVHGGLFNAPETKNSWNAIPVTATMTNYIQNNLRSANPPPGATEQYVGTPRMGNNYVPMPGTYWYNPVGEQQGQYRMKVTHQCEQRSFGENGLPVNTDGTYTYTPVLLQGGKDANQV